MKERPNSRPPEPRGGSPSILAAMVRRHSELRRSIKVAKGTKRTEIGRQIKVMGHRIASLKRRYNFDENNGEQAEQGMEAHE